MSKNSMDNNKPIGVFDSGVGGLTVLAALQAALPNESFIYLGDTARLPYGTKSADCVTHYAKNGAGYLMEKGIKLLVVACNTATSVALPLLQVEFAPIPVIGVIVPGAQAAIAQTQNQSIAVLATEGTVQSQAYTRAIHAINPGIMVNEYACPMFVPLAEEGWVEGEEVEMVIKRSLKPMLDANTQADTLLLGCTHFPILKPTLAKMFPGMHIIDSADTTAKQVHKLLHQGQLYSDQQQPHTEFLATDSLKRFQRIAERFLKKQISDNQLNLISLTPQSRLPRTDDNIATL